MIDRIRSVVEKWGLLAAGPEMVLTESLNKSTNIHNTVEFMYLTEDFEDHEIYSERLQECIRSEEDDESVKEKRFFRQGAIRWVNLRVPMPNAKLAGRGFPIIILEEWAHYTASAQVVILAILDDTQIRVKILLCIWTMRTRQQRMKSSPTM